MSTRTLPRPADPAIDLLGVDPGGLSDSGVESALVGVRVLISRLEAASSRLIGEAERRGIPVSRGFGSATSWLIATTGDPPGVCRSRVRVARRLRDMPVTVETFTSGELSECRVRVLAEAADAAPETFARDEELLVDQALSLDARSFPKAVAHWRRLTDQDRFRDDQEGMHESRSLHLSRTWAGMGRIDGNLDPESTETVATALRTLSDPSQLDPGDMRTPGQRRADALVEISLFYLDHANTARIGGEKPHVTVTVDLEVLEGRSGGRCELGSGGEITPQAALRLACDAQITRIITNGPSQPLDVGRSTRTIAAGIHKALAVRDGGCTHPGCGIPPGWCDAHHITHWAHGGPTALSNLTLLCRRHHRIAHRHHQHHQRE